MSTAATPCATSAAGPSRPTTTTPPDRRRDQGLESALDRLPSPRLRSPSHPNADSRRPFGLITGRPILLSGWTRMCYRSGNSAPEMFDTLAELLATLVAQSQQADMCSFD